MEDEREEGPELPDSPYLLHRETAQEKEFIDSCDDVPETGTELTKVGGRGIRSPLDKLTDEQINDVCDKVVMGTSITKLASELGVNSTELSRAVKTRMGTLYLRRWQQSVNFDCLRAEVILKTAMGRLDEAPKWGKLALEVLAYRARILGFENTTLEETTVRVAGLSQAEIFAEIKKKL